MASEAERKELASGPLSSLVIDERDLMVIASVNSLLLLALRIAATQTCSLISAFVLANSLVAAGGFYAQ